MPLVKESHLAKRSALDLALSLKPRQIGHMRQMDLHALNYAINLPAHLQAVPKAGRLPESLSDSVPHSFRCNEQPRVELELDIYIYISTCLKSNEIAQVKSNGIREVRLVVSHRRSETLLEEPKTNLYKRKTCTRRKKRKR